MKVVVTGGSGRVGQTVVQTLVQEGLTVINLDRQGPAERWSRFVDVDLSNAGDVYDVLAEQKPLAVVHLAADARSMGRVRHSLFMENVGIAHAVMQAAGDLGVERLVYASSEQASGWTSARSHPKTLPADEDAMLTPQSAYSLSKYVGEIIAESVAARHRSMSVQSLRFNYVALPESYEKFREWRPQEHHSGNLWGYVDVRDVADAVSKALKSSIRGHRAYNINAADIFSHLPTRQAVSQWLDSEIELPDHLPEFGSLIDCSRADRELGWKPKHSWRQGMG